MATALAVSCGLLSGCSGSDEVPGDQIATLYRNGSLVLDTRIQFATFDAEGESNNFNINNCEMAVRLLNQNVIAQSPDGSVPKVGFWCEPGAVRNDGRVPEIFDAAFPTEVDGFPAP